MICLKILHTDTNIEDHREEDTPHVVIKVEVITVTVIRLPCHQTTEEQDDSQYGRHFIFSGVTTRRPTHAVSYLC